MDGRESAVDLTLMTPLMWVYGAIVGAWFVILPFAFYNRSKLLQLKAEPAADPHSPQADDQQPFVSVIVPARNEARNLELCVRSVLASEFARLELLIVDDRSTDATPEIAAWLVRESNQARLISLQDSPRSWTGKPFALHSGVQQARGDWFLFLDADTTLSPQNLRSAMQYVQREKLDALSLFGGMRCETVCEEILQPLASIALCLMFRLPHVNSDQHPTVALANGQYLLVSRRAYERIGGHQSVKNQLMEDIAIAERLKSHGLRLRLANSVELLQVRMYASLREILHGWSRIYQGSVRGKTWKLWALLFASVTCSLSAFLTSLFWLLPAALAGAPNVGLLATLNVVHHLLIWITTAPLYRDTGCRARALWGYGLAVSTVCVALMRAIWMTYSRSVTWRGVRYSLESFGNASGSPGEPVTGDPNTLPSLAEID